MSAIVEMKKALGTQNLTMRYGDGGKTEVFTADRLEYRFPGGTALHTVTEVIKAGRLNLGANSN